MMNILTYIEVVSNFVRLLYPNIRTLKITIPAENYTFPLYEDTYTHI